MIQEQINPASLLETLGGLPSAISKKEIKEKAPALFTKSPHPKMSDHYKFVNTESVVKHFQDIGFVIFDATQLNLRKSDNNNEGYQLHGILMYHPNLVFINEETGILEKIFQIFITNSHNGYSKCAIHCSFYNIANNSDLLCVSDEYTEIVNSNSLQDLNNAVSGVSNHFIGMVKLVRKMKTRILTYKEKSEIAFGMCKIRHSFKDGEDCTYDTRLLLTPQRPEDSKNDLWSTYCNVQEKLIKGYTFADKKIRKIRAVNHFELSMNLNINMFAFIKKYL